MQTLAHEPWSLQHRDVQRIGAHGALGGGHLAKGVVAKACLEVQQSWRKGNSTKTIQAFPRLSTYVSSYSDYPRLILALHCRRPRMQTAAAGSRPEPVGNCDGLCCGTSSRFGTSQHEVGQHPKVAIIGQDIPSWIRPNSFIAKQRVERSDGAIKVAKGCKGSLPGHQETTKTWNYQKLEVCFVVLDCSLTFSVLTLALESSFSW